MKGTRVVMAAAIVGAFGAATLEAQDVKIGAQASFAQDTDFGIGPRVELGLTPAIPGLVVAGSFDYFFPGDRTVQEGEGVGSTDTDYWELNANLIYGFEVASAPGVEPYFGAGLNFSHASGQITTPGGTVEASDDNAGVNLVGGAKFPLTGLTTFLEMRLELKGDDPLGIEDQFVLAGGILFP